MTHRLLSHVHERSTERLDMVSDGRGTRHEDGRPMPTRNTLTDMQNSRFTIRDWNPC